MNVKYYSFLPQPSVQQLWLKRFGLILLLASLLTWPSHLPWWLSLLRFMLALALVSAFWLWRKKVPTNAFTLAENGKGLWYNGCAFQLTSKTRLMPMVVLLHTEAGDWIWHHRDSFDHVQWRRLCRIALLAQQL